MVVLFVMTGIEVVSITRLIVGTGLAILVGIGCFLLVHLALLVGLVPPEELVEGDVLDGFISLLAVILFLIVFVKLLLDLLAV